MPDGFPLEALKAQAVAARSEVLAKLGRAHSGDPFDVCADVHCQVYSGLSKRAKSTDQAVRETAGLVLWHDDRIASAFYSAVCGGHTEDAGNVWGGRTAPYLHGRLDGPDRADRFGPLTDESNVRRWIDASPQVFCNTMSEQIPKVLDYTKKYVRWEVQTTQGELRQTILDKTGRDVGDIVELCALERGVSGRIIRLEIKGTEGSLTIGPELAIRKALSASTLWSACFYVKKEELSGGIPGAFVIRGAGWGHGVGMCQTGAAMMALERNTFDAILKHYYRGVAIRRLY